MYKFCSVAVAGLVAGWLTLATPAASQAQAIGLSIGTGPVVVGGAYYRPSYYRYPRRGRVVVGGYVARPVIVQPAPVIVAPRTAPIVVTPSPAPVVVPQRGYYVAPY